MGSATTDHAARKRLRKRLEARGVDPASVAAAVEAKRVEQLARRALPPVANLSADPSSRRSKMRADRSRRPSAASYGAYPPVFRPDPERVPQRTEPTWDPDDTGYKPGRADSLTSGQARATGVTAKVARRGRTVTRWEWDRMQAGA